MQVKTSNRSLLNTYVDSEFLSDCNLDVDAEQKLRESDFAYFIAAVMPTASGIRYERVALWGHWVRYSIHIWVSVIT